MASSDVKDLTVKYPIVLIFLIFCRGEEKEKVWVFFYTTHTLALNIMFDIQFSVTNWLSSLIKQYSSCIDRKNYPTLESSLSVH